MRITSSQFASRPDYFDRNPIIRWQQYVAAGIAPHGGTVRWTYTVPAGKKAYLENGFMQTRRDSVAAPAGQALASIRYTPNGGTIARFAATDVSTNAVGDKDAVVLGPLALLMVGDVVDSLTQDGSTGGVMTHIATAKITEFDI